MVPVIWRVPLTFKFGNILFYLAAGSNIESRQKKKPKESLSATLMGDRQ
jgi:hypothetical protein